MCHIRQAKKLRAQTRLQHVQLYRSVRSTASYYDLLLRQNFVHDFDAYKREKNFVKLAERAYQRATHAQRHSRLGRVSTHLYQKTNERRQKYDELSVRAQPVLLYKK